MSGIRGGDTKPELFLRSRLHAVGFRFRLHVKEIPGKPDIVLPKYSVLINVHGCFWHGHGCNYSKIPQTNKNFWVEKITANRERDERNLVSQLDLGWRCLTIWECAIRSCNNPVLEKQLLRMVFEWIKGGAKVSTIDGATIKKMLQKIKADRGD